MLTKEEFEVSKEYGTYEDYVLSHKFDLTPQGIKNAVMEILEAPDGWDTEVTTRGGKRESVLPRQVAMYIMKNFTNMTTPQIGREFGQSHCNVIYATKSINNAIKTGGDPTLKKMAKKVIDFYKNFTKIE